MTERDDHAHDTDAIRDVASNDMSAIANDIEDALALFRGTGSPFGTLIEKWNQASSGITTGMVTSQERVEEAGKALKRTADDYDGVETRIITDFQDIFFRHNR